MGSIDLNDSGTITMPDVLLFLKSITDDLSEDNIERMFDGLEHSKNKTKTVNFEEFKEVMTSLTENGWNRNNQEKEEMNDAGIKESCQTYKGQIWDRRR